MISIAVVGAIGVFAGGAALGYSLSNGDDSDDDASGVPTRGDTIFGSNDTADAEGRARGMDGFGGSAPAFGQDGAERDEAMIMPRDRCPGPVGDILQGGVLDLANQGFAANLLEGGFVLTGMSVRSEGECDDEGRAQNGSLVLDTSWTHSETGLDVSVSQRADADSRANVRHAEGAQFWLDGYEYSVWASPRWHYAYDDGRDVARSPAGSVSDERISEVVDEVLAQLAPDIPSQCFYREHAGDWEDLATVGLGDPRGAVPSDFNESHFELRTYIEPDADCPGSGEEAPTGASFFAGFASGNGWLDISGWRFDGEQGRVVTDRIDDWSVSWSTGEWQLAINGGRDGDSLGRDVLGAIASALDPSFDNTCFIEQRELSPDELDGLGFRQPLIPDGFEVRQSTLQVMDVPEGCDRGDDSNIPAYSLNWAITDGEVFYEVTIDRWPTHGDHPVASEGYISDKGMAWVNGDGDAFNIWARSADGSSARDQMVAIAESIDPTLDVSSLHEEQGGGAPDMPRPMPEPADGPAPADTN